MCGLPARLHLQPAIQAADPALRAESADSARFGKTSGSLPGISLDRSILVCGFACSAGEHQSSMVLAALDAYESAGISGLCAEGRWEIAVQAIHIPDLVQLVDEFQLL